VVVGVGLAGLHDADVDPDLGERPVELSNMTTVPAAAVCIERCVVCDELRWVG
jgi:hypothetical protein